MAARLTRPARSTIATGTATARLVAAVVAIVAVCGCGPSSGPADGQPPAPRPTPQTSLSAEMAGTAALVTDAVAGQGIRLDAAVVAVQPAEPAGVAAAPRALLQADVHDPGGGYVLIYQFVDPAAATTRGAEFVDYLESGPGQVNYPLDTQFSLAQVGSTLVFTWWSRERSADPERAELAFDAIASVGEAIPIVK